MAETPEYPRIFNRLCHMAALTKEGRERSVVDGLMLTVASLDDKLDFSSSPALKEAISQYFGVSVTEELLRAAVERRRSNGSLAKSAGVLRPIPAVIADREAQIKEAADLETKVRAEWLADCARAYPALGDAHHAHLWGCLQGYLSWVFERHGAETTKILDPNYAMPDRVRGPLAAALARTLDDKADATCRGAAEKLLPEFLKNPSRQRRLYLTSLLDGTLSYFSLVSDEATTQALRSTLKPLRLFLDTNFIFSLLEIHENPLAAVSRDLVDLIRANKLPITLHYHQQTFEEMASTVDAVARSLLGRRWSSALSRAALQSAAGVLSGMELRYHELNAVAPVSADVFVDRFRNLRALLDARDIKIYRDPPGVNDLATEGDMIARYDEYLKRRRGDTKPYESIKHDVIVLRAMDRTHDFDAALLESGALLLTNDFWLQRFEWSLLRDKKGKRGSVVLPTQLMEILRPMMKLDEKSVLSLLGAIAMPEFRVSAAGRPETVHRVLSFLRVYEDLAPEVANRLLADSVLMSSVDQVREDEPAFAEAVESALARQNKQLLEESVAHREEITKLREDHAASAREIAAARESAAGASKRAEETSVKADDLKKQVEELDERARTAEFVAMARKELAKAERDQAEAIKERGRRRAIRAAFWVGTAGVCALLLWLTWSRDYAVVDKPAKRILMSACVLGAGVGFLYPKLRGVLWGSLVVSAGVGLISLL